MSWQKYLFLACLVALVLLPGKAEAFGAGNIASISRIEGKNWRHGDIEDLLKTVAFLPHHKWTSLMIKRAYFGNWLRDYSQAVDVGSLERVPAQTIRILVWILGFMSFGYATGEFEVTDERLGCYRPEEHIDNPKDYADNKDAREFDKRLRGPVAPEELAIDPETGMKNYISNEEGGWATSSGYVKYSFKRSIHFGRLYTHGANKGREEDLCEALRCLGQGLHCLEDFGAHTQYVELCLRELGYSNVFPHVGTATQINLRGKSVFPLVTGTFGGVDFLHSVIGEASDHMTQSEVDEANNALANASGGNRAHDVGADAMINVLSKVPGTSDLSQQARGLQVESDNQAAANQAYENEPSSQYSNSRGFNPATFISGAGKSGQSIQQLAQTDPQEIVRKIYPILLFRDNVVRTINGVISKIPGLEAIVEKITETVTLFVMRLLAPFVMPLISIASQGLKQGSTAVVHSSTQQQYLVWDDIHSSDPTHSMLSKDHFSNILNDPAGKVAGSILQYAAPRVIYAWNHPEVPDDQVCDDVLRSFHHPALRDMNCEVQRNMFNTVEQWARSYQGENLNSALSSESVKAGKNHKAEAMPAQGFQAYSQAFNQGSSAVFGRRDLDESSGGYPGYVPSTESQYAPPSTIPTAPNEQQSGQTSQEATGSSSGWQPPPASFQPGDPYAYPSAYQQGYEPQFGGPQEPQGPGPYGQQPPPGSYGGPPQFQGQQPMQPYGGPPPGPYGGQQGYGSSSQYGQGGYAYGQGPSY